LRQIIRNTARLRHHSTVIAIIIRFEHDVSSSYCP
jgi:hypothetical protein